MGDIKDRSQINRISVNFYLFVVTVTMLLIGTHKCTIQGRTKSYRLPRSGDKNSFFFYRLLEHSGNFLGIFHVFLAEGWSSLLTQTQPPSPSEDNLYAYVSTSVYQLPIHVLFETRTACTETYC